MIILWLSAGRKGIDISIVSKDPESTVRVYISHSNHVLGNLSHRPRLDLFGSIQPASQMAIPFRRKRTTGESKERQITYYLFPKMFDAEPEAGADGKTMF